MQVVHLGYSPGCGISLRRRAGVHDKKNRLIYFWTSGGDYSPLKVAMLHPSGITTKASD